MKQLIFFLVLLFFSTAYSVYALGNPVAEAEVIEFPVPDSPEQSDEGILVVNPPDNSAERKRLSNEWHARVETLSGLERVAVDNITAPRREDVLPYRFSNVSRLQSMLREPEWAYDWSPIATTIGMAADKKAAIDLIAFIKDSNAPTGYDREWEHARLRAIVALGYSLIDQDIPEAIEFLERLLDPDYMNTLQFDFRLGDTIRHKAYSALSIAASDPAIALLKKRRALLDDEKRGVGLQIHSVGDSHASELDKKIESIDSYISLAKEYRVGRATQK